MEHFWVTLPDTLKIHRMSIGCEHFFAVIIGATTVGLGGMAMSVRAKFIVTTKTEFATNGQDGQTTTAHQVRLAPVKDELFGPFTPAGNLDMTIHNLGAAAQLIVGQEYYLDLTPVPPVATGENELWRHYTVIVNGHPVNIGINEAVNDGLHGPTRIVDRALSVSHQPRSNAWELRDEAGNLVEGDKLPASGTTLFLNLRAGVGA